MKNYLEEIKEAFKVQGYQVENENPYFCSMIKDINISVISCVNIHLYSDKIIISWDISNSRTYPLNDEVITKLCETIKAF